MTLYDLAVPTFVQMLTSMSGQLDNAAAFAADNGLDPAELIDARLAPDMFPLATQVRFACFQALMTMKELTGVEPPEFADDETTIEGLKGQIGATVAFLKGVPAAAINAGGEKALSLTMQNGIVFDLKSGEQFVRDWALPQFYFHLITAYAIMRHKGVGLGKPDYVPYMFPYIRPGTMPGAA